MMKWYSTKKYKPPTSQEVLIRIIVDEEETDLISMAWYWNNCWHWGEDYVCYSDPDEKTTEIIGYKVTHFCILDPIELEEICHDQKLFIQIEDAGFTLRTFVCLKAECINTLGKLITFSESDLLKIPNLGKKSLNEIKEVLSKYELKLK
jgi:Bacterial RNA polymerase, alpha chain C terminal domain